MPAVAQLVWMLLGRDFPARQPEFTESRRDCDMIYVLCLVFVHTFWHFIRPTMERFRADAGIGWRASRSRSLSLIALLVVMTSASGARSQTADRVVDPGRITTQSEDAPKGLFFAGPVPRTKFIADDAALNDVCSVAGNCWAVGDRGVLLTSRDAGQTWTTSVLSKECRLLSVCFLTNQIGYVAGARFDSFERRHRSVLLMTRDGGTTWRDLAEIEPHSTGVVAGFTAAGNLPPLTYVRFFDLENAVAIGRGDSPGASAKVFRSQDGGKFWSLIESESDHANWTSGAFLSADDGIVVGGGNALGAVVSRQVVALQQPQQSLQQIYAASVSQDGEGWVAGDAAYLQHSGDGGITWKPVTSGIPRGMSDVIDFHSVCHRGSHVCVAGTPGSMVLQSSDGGTTWNARKLPGCVPIHAMAFVGDSTVLAVGAFGVIHRSADAGNTWVAIRNSEYRSAVLCLTTDPADVSLLMLSSISGNEGFRSVVAQPSARRTRQGVDDMLAAERLSTVLPQTGTSAFVQDWMFARSQPMQSKVADELMKAWEQQTDGRVAELLPQRLAEFIRTWRPDVVCIERSAESDQVAAIWSQAIGAAMKISAGNDRRAEMLDSVGLEPWTVKRVMIRQPSRGSSPVVFHQDSLLSNLGTSCELIAGFCRRQLQTEATNAENSPERRTSSDSYTVHFPGDAVPVPHLLAGMMAAPGTASRRMLTPVAPDHIEQLKRMTQQFQQERAVLASQTRSTDTPLNLIAQLKGIGAKLPDHLAMQQLLSLSRMYESVENLDGQIAVLKEITERFPDSPEAADANEQLFQFYSSAELRFLRRQAGRTDMVQRKSAGGADGSFIQQVGGSIPGIGRPPVIRRGNGTSLPNPRGKDTAAVTELWNRNADTALENLKRLSPARARSPELLLRHAANLRQRQDDSRSNSALSIAGNSAGSFALLARAEMQALFAAPSTPVPVINLTKAESKPFLDATLDDAIWEDAKELRLLTVGPNGLSTDPGCLIMIAWDNDHIYLSGRADRVPGRPYSMDKTQDRNHDTDHQIRDRIDFAFDIDRDYTTAFHFTIDEAGQVSERCWKSRRWNPDWFVSADMDENSWRFEIAIPQEEMIAQPLQPGNLWAIRIQRNVPGVLQQSLKDPDSEVSATDVAGHGLLRFIRQRK